MQRLGSSPRALYRRTATRQPFHQIVRRLGRKPWPSMKAASLWRGAPIFDVNSLLLDLDAENAKNVRQYDPEIDGEPEDHYATRSRDRAVLEARIHDFLQKSIQEANKFEKTISDRSYEWHINDLDVLSAVLRGPALRLQSVAHGDKGSPATAVEAMPPKAWENLHANILERNGIPQDATRDGPKLLAYMLHQKEQAQARSSSGLISESSLPDLIHKQKDFGKLKRMVWFLLETSDGSQLVSKLGEEIGKVCSKLASDSREAAAYGVSSILDLLAFSNDIVMNLSDRRLPVETALWQFGFQLAVRCSEISAAQMYLTAGLRSGSQATSASEHLIGPLRTVLRSVDSQEFLSTRPEHYAAVFSFVTGRDFIEQDAISSIHNMMRLAQPSDSTALAVYIQILGELGALRTLWHIYQHILGSTLREDARRGVFNDEAIHFQDLPSSTTADMAAKTSGQGSSQFLSAFSRIVRKVLKDKHLIGAFKYNEATGVFGEDCSLDLQTIRRLHRGIRQDHQHENQAAAEGNAKARNCRESLPSLQESTGWQSNLSTADINTNLPDLDLDQQVLDAFANPDIKEALTALHNILVEKTVNTTKPMETPSRTV